MTVFLLKCCPLSAKQLIIFSSASTAKLSVWHPAIWLYHSLWIEFRRCRHSDALEVLCWLHSFCYLSKSRWAAWDCKLCSDTSSKRGEAALEGDGNSLVIPACEYRLVWDLAYSPMLGQLGQDVIRSSCTFVSLHSTQHHLCQTSCAFGVILVGFHILVPNWNIC